MEYQLSLQAHCPTCQQVIRESPAQRGQVRSSADVFSQCEDMHGLQQEELHVFALDTRNHIIGRTMVYRGKVDSVPVRPAEIFREALKAGASGIIVVHNHPSGDPTPSADDVRVTRDLVAAGKVLDIELLDHLVIGDTQHGFVSLRERKLGFEV